MSDERQFPEISVENAKAEALKARAARAAAKKAAKEGTVAERNLRVTKWLSSTPAIGVCSSCGKEFRVPMTALTRTKDAQAHLQEQFDRHECKHRMAG
jgi:hypothetical protein